MAAGTKPQDEPKFMVSYSSLLALFSMFCFKCKAEKPEVKMGQTGTMVTVEQRCASCHGSKQFKWQSQPCLLGRYPVGNILLSFSLLPDIPSILIYWESYQASLIQSLRNVQNAVLSGDGHFDSMGHSAKYGVYTMFCCTIMKIVHFDLLQVSTIYLFIAGEIF